MINELSFTILYNTRLFQLNRHVEKIPCKPLSIDVFNV